MNTCRQLDNDSLDRAALFRNELVAKLKNVLPLRL